MPRACRCCTHPRKAEINDALRSGGTKAETATRFNVGRESLWRHRTNCIGLAPKRATPAASPSRSAPGDSTRNETLLSDGCCKTCGFIPPDGISGGDLLRRMDRIVAVTERFMLSAEADGDMRGAVLAARETRASMETMMRTNAVGMIGGDGVTINAGQQREMTVAQAFNILMNAIDPERRDELRVILHAFAHGERYALPIGDLVDGEFALAPPTIVA